MYAEEWAIWVEAFDNGWSNAVPVHLYGMSLGLIAYIRAFIEPVSVSILREGVRNES
jgi:hypothetical protein